MSASPTFVLLYSLATVVRRNIGKDKIVDALKTNSGATSFVENTLVLSGFTARWGEWLAPQSDGKWNYADSGDAIALPIWQDPSLRFDSEGGMTLLQGKWTAKTNVIDLDSLAVGDELVVGTLESDDPVLPSGVGLVRLADQSSGSSHMVVAHVEEIQTDGVVINNQLAGYFRVGG